MLKKIIFTILFSFFLISHTYSEESFISLNKLKNHDMNKVFFLRHALAPGNGDPSNFNVNDCSTQRNLNQNGINQSKNIGKFFKINQISIDEVLSSEWCRCKDTAFYAFRDFKTFDALNSFFDERFAANEERQIIKLKKFISNWNSDKNLVLVTHYVVINSILGVGSGSGEIIITDKSLLLRGRIDKY